MRHRGIRLEDREKMKPVNVPVNRWQLTGFSLTFVNQDFFNFGEVLHR